MRRASALSFVCASALLSLAPAVQAARWIVPASAHADGLNNTKFRSDLFVVNAGTAAAEIQVRFLQAGSDNSLLPDPVTRTVGAGQQLTVVDVVDSFFGRIGGGALMIDSASTALVISSSTYNKQPDKTYGLFLQGLPVESAIPAGETGHITALAKSDLYRTNLGFANASGDNGFATVKIYGAHSELLGERTIQVFAWGQTQITDVFGAAGAEPTTVARAEVTATVPVFAYATPIDNRTGDSFAAVAQRVSSAATELILTSAAHLAGANNAQFRSDLRIFNTEGSAGSITLALYPINQDSPTPVTRSVSVSARELVGLDDVILGTFGLSSAAGAIKITSDRKLLALSRTYNDAPEGTSGQDLPAVPLTSYASKGDTIRLSALSSDGARTNVIIFNAGTDALVLDLTLNASLPASARGPLASFSSSIDVKAGSLRQINDIFGTLGAPAGSTGFLTMKATSGGPFYAVGTVIKADSNDPYQVAGAIEKATTPPPPPPQDDCVTVGIPPTGVTFGYSVSDSGGGSATFTLNYSSVSLTDARQRTVTTTAVGTTDTQSHIAYQLGGPDNNVFLLTLTEQTTSAFGFTITSSTTYNPGRASNFYRQCVGAMLDIPSVTATTTASVGGSSNVATSPGTMTIAEVNVPMSSPAGTFQTVHRHFVYTAPPGVAGTYSALTDEWDALGDGQTVKQVTTDSAGKVTTTVRTQ